MTAADNPYNIPFDALDAFYFGGVVPSMPLSLQGLAVDSRILCHSPEKSEVQSIRHVFGPEFHHFYIPFVLDDIFSVPEQTLLTLGKAWLLTMVDIIITDNGIDLQLPAIPIIPLLQQQMRHHSLRLYRELFGQSETFWRNYDLCLGAYWTALAQEFDHQLRRTYTADAAQQIATGKGATYRLMIDAMSELSGDRSAVAPLHRIFHQIMSVELILDDACDWQEDAANGRVSLPIMLALERATIPMTELETLSTDALANLLVSHSILLSLADQCLESLESARTDLVNAHLEETKVAAIVRNHTHLAQRFKEQCQAQRFLGAVSTMLEDRPTKLEA